MYWTVSRSGYGPRSQVPGPRSSLRSIIKIFGFTTFSRELFRFRMHYIMKVHMFTSNSCVVTIHHKLTRKRRKHPSAAMDPLQTLSLQFPFNVLIHSFTFLQCQSKLSTLHLPCSQIPVLGKISHVHY